MNIIKKNIPNLITLFNLTCGVFAINFAFKGDFNTASMLIFLGALFDFFDGLLARFLGLNNKLGKELDSMADMVTFGVAPAFILFHFIFYLDNNLLFINSKSNALSFPAILAFLTPILSAYRLAKFNIDKRQEESFIGLPTPALAILFAAIPHINFEKFPMFTDVTMLSILAILLPIMLIVEMPIFSLKFNKNQPLSSKLNLLRIIIIIISIVFFLIFKFAAVPFIITLYLFLSLINNLLKS